MAALAASRQALRSAFVEACPRFSSSTFNDYLATGAFEWAILSRRDLAASHYKALALAVTECVGRIDVSCVGTLQSEARLFNKVYTVSEGYLKWSAPRRIKAIDALIADPVSSRLKANWRRMGASERTEALRHAASVMAAAISEAGFEVAAPTVVSATIADTSSAHYSAATQVITLSERLLMRRPLLASLRSLRHEFAHHVQRTLGNMSSDDNAYLATHGLEHDAVIFWANLSSALYSDMGDAKQNEAYRLNPVENLAYMESVDAEGLLLDRRLMPQKLRSYVASEVKSFSALFKKMRADFSRICAKPAPEPEGKRLSPVL